MKEQDYSYSQLRTIVALTCKWLADYDMSIDSKRRHYYYTKSEIEMSLSNGKIEMIEARRLLETLKLFREEFLGGNEL
jgi:hypothetical protein